MKNKKSVTTVIFKTLRLHLFLSLGILCAVIGAIVMALLPPMILDIVIDTLTTGQALPVTLVILYYVFLALTDVTESVRESLLTVFGQKITHSLRSSLMEKYAHLTTNISIS